VLAEAGVCAGERGEHGLDGERAETVEHAEGVVAREGIGEGAEQRDGGSVLALVKEARGGVAMPAVGVGEGGDQFGGGGGAEGDAGAALPRGVVGHEAVEAAAVVAAVEVEVLFDLFGMLHGCSMTSRYMSQMWSVPSGASAKFTTRTQVSVLAANS